ncbi:hypothetical protein ABW19_dt0207866 [Dactylella cylindrospora]|nr:hypothetical protein ABW19_dt0207866 [Dactylella cylindrospora]
MCGVDCFLAILAVLFPPIAVWVKRGVCSGDSIINIALMCLGYLPGLLHAWYIIAKYPDPLSYSYESIEGGNQRVYYYTATYPSVNSHTQPHHHHHHCSTSQQPRPASQPGPQSYGTTAAPATPSAPPAPPARTETEIIEPTKPSPPPQDQLVVVDGMDHSGGASSSAGPSQPPPSYNDVIKGDYKVQTD